MLGVCPTIFANKQAFPPYNQKSLLKKEWNQRSADIQGCSITHPSDMFPFSTVDKKKCNKPTYYLLFVEGVDHIQDVSFERLKATLKLRHCLLQGPGHQAGGTTCRRGISVQQAPALAHILLPERISSSIKKF